MPFAPKAPVDLALKERIRFAYYDENKPIAEVEEVAGVGRATLYRWFHAWNWPLRKPMRSRPQARQDPPPFVAGAAPSAGRAAVAAGRPALAEAGWQPGRRESPKLRLKRLVEHRIAILEHEAMTGVAVDPEVNARAIELNARTLVTIERLSDPEPCPRCSDGRPPRSIAELRDELHAHLHRIRREERERRGVPVDEDEDEDEDRAP